MAEAAGSGTVSGSHIYVDDDGGPFTVTVTVTDDSGVSHSDTLVVTVNNVDPAIVMVRASQTIDIGTAMGDVGDLVGFTDPGAADTHRAVVVWGDGAYDDGVVDQAAGGVSGSHVFTTAGVFAVTVMVIDDDGGVALAWFMITVGSGAPPTGAVDIPLVAGLNLIGVSTLPSTATAADVAVQITAQGGEAAQVIRWDEGSQSYVLWSAASPAANNFVMRPDRGYFILVVTPPTGGIWRVIGE